MNDRTTFDIASKPPALRCANCGATQPVVLPMKLSDVTATLDTFTAKHARCTKKDDE